MNTPSVPADPDDSLSPGVESLSEAAAADGPARPPVLARLFSIDVRSLAVFRMGLGLFLLVDLAIRAGDLTAMYTDSGMFPRQEIQSRYTSVWNWSFHFLSGSWGFQALLFGLAALFGVALLTGYKTRWAVVASWLMAVSIQNRVPPILNGGDDLFRMLLFWGMFLPLGAVWSLDSRRRARLAEAAGSGLESGSAPHPDKVLSVATAAVMIQMALMYLCSAIFKTNADWFHGEVIAKTLAHDFYAKPMAGLILKSGVLLKGMTWGIFAFEWLAPLLLFVPWKTVRIRLLVVAALAVMHLGIELNLHVGMFSWVALTGLLVFVPAEFWERWPRFRFSQPVSFLTNNAEPAESPPQSARGLGSRVAGLCCALALVQVLVVNIGGLLARPGQAGGLGAWSFANLGLGLGQKWNMFEETPSKDGWYLARATLANKSEIDLLRGGDPIDWTKPDHAAGLYPNHRWRKLFREMAYEDSLGYQVFRIPVARYLVRRWNESRRGESSKQVVQFEFVYSMEHDSRSPDNKLVQVAVHRRLFRLDPALITPAL